MRSGYYLNCVDRVASRPQREFGTQALLELVLLVFNLLRRSSGQVLVPLLAALILHRTLLFCLCTPFYPQASLTSWIVTDSQIVLRDGHQ